MARGLRFISRQVLTSGSTPISRGECQGVYDLAHVLFDGDIRQHPALRSLFWQWGVTVGRLRPSGGGRIRATVEDCDAVVFLADRGDPQERDSSAMPDGAETGGVAAAEAAPLLVIGTGPVRGKPWVVIPEPGPGGSRLRAALQSCRERAGMLRGDPYSRHDQDQFRNFLGHELRSPLTAIKTALTVLDSDTGNNQGSGRMIRIALRNLDRLAETVEWSQELLSLAEAPPAAELGPVSVADLTAGMPAHLDLKVAESLKGLLVVTDTRLMSLLAGQMERVLTFARPGGHPFFQIESDPATGECRLIGVVADGSADKGSRRVSGSGGPGAGLNRAGWHHLELEHLVRMLISPHLLQMLGVKPRIRAEDPDRVELTVELSLWGGVYSPTA